MTNEQLMDLLRGMFPPGTHTGDTAYVMGGAAICPQLAGDVDVWVFTEGREWVPGEVERWGTLHPWAFFNPFALEGEAYDEGYQEIFRNSSDFAQFDIRILGMFEPAASVGKPIQVLSVTAGTMSQVLDSFDISTHKWALHLATGHLTMGFGATSPLQMPQVLRWNTPQRTAERMAKLLPRYGWRLDHNPDVPNLQALYMPSPSVALDKAS